MTTEMIEFAPSDRGAGVRVGPGVYVLLDDVKQAIYIGATRNLSRRLGEHRRKPWWSEALTGEWYPQSNWQSALWVERFLLHQMNPYCNRQSTDPHARARNFAWSMIFSQVERHVAEAGV